MERSAQKAEDGGPEKDFQQHTQLILIQMLQGSQRAAILLGWQDLINGKSLING